jgi:hypothetical protein
MQRLKGLREHYVKVDSLNWKPKKSYNSVDEIKRDLGHRFKKMHHYRCGLCNKLHTSRYPAHDKVNTS